MSGWQGNATIWVSLTLTMCKNFSSSSFLFSFCFSFFRGAGFRFFFSGGGGGGGGRWGEEGWRGGGVAYLLRYASFLNKGPYVHNGRKQISISHFNR